MAKKIRIGGATGYWGESMMGTPQFLAAGDMDYIVYDFLAEITMSIMARARQANPDMGYATDFISGVLKPNLAEIAGQGVKIISNAGGVNPEACAAAARELVAAQNLDLKIAVVTGDDLISRAKELAAADVREMFSGAGFPDPAQMASINAYLGAFPIAAALDAGADIVITGRAVDSAVTLGACIHEFGWMVDDFDCLAGGSLAGHIIECGPQSTGGNFTDWSDVPDMAAIGYPVVEIDRDGGFICTKPDATGGLVNIGTVAEQMLYEIGDPQTYILPDVTCDFSQVTLTQNGKDRVRVTGAKGRPAPAQYKVSATYAEGFKAGTMVSFTGIEADKKAAHFADGVLARCREIFRQKNQPDFEETSIEVLGAESQYGAAAKPGDCREVVLKIAVKHEDIKAAGLLLRQLNGMALATPPGLALFGGSRAKPSPVVRLFSFLIDQKDVPVRIKLEDQAVAYQPGVTKMSAELARPDAPVIDAISPEDMIKVPLIKLAWGRSGDKGNKANIGIIARDPAYLPYIWAALDEPTIRQQFAHFLDADSGIDRYYLPGSHAMNIVMHEVLGGGGVASLRADPQGKAYAQILLDHPIAVTREMGEKL